MTKKTYYVVMENGFEYNDEVYHRPESEGGKPLKVFSNLKKAQKCAEELNFEMIKSMEADQYTSLSSYGYELKEIVTEEGEDFLKENKCLSDDPDEYLEIDLSKLSDKKLRELCGHLVNPFYEVYEVEG